MQSLKLFMVLLGCKPNGRHTEQHDIFFGIGNTLKDLAKEMYAFWPESNRKLHIDAWREVNTVDEYSVAVVDRDAKTTDSMQEPRLFFLNLGGYKPGEFEEFHYKILSACRDKAVAIQRCKKTVFYRHTGFTGATSHIDDKYGVDVDDVYEIADILPPGIKQKYKIVLSPAIAPKEDKLHLGYLMLEKL